MRRRTSAGLVFAAMLGLVACAGSAPAAPGTPGQDQDAAQSEAPDPASVADLDCGDGELISRRMSSGATWSMCWSVDPKLGLVLTDIHLAPPGEKPVSVIASLSISQLEVPYDTGERLTSDITSAGFGGSKMQTLDEASCVGERMGADIPNVGDGSYGKTPHREVLCSEVVDAGIAYHSSDVAAPAADRSSDWQLSTISRVGWYEYVSQYVFAADGSIRVRLGATGDLSPVDHTDEEHGWPVGPADTAHAASHSHNAVWRVHWALGGPTGMAVEQYDAEPTGESGKEAPILEGKTTPLERPATSEWVDRRWWRVLAPEVLNDDDHPISYQIDLERTDSFTFVEDHEHGEEDGYDVAFTNADECQIFATKNRGTCGAGVPEFVTRGSDETLDDVVSWVAVGFHHVPRDEDQSPMELHWQGFSLLPRDFTARRFDVPKGREDVNGVPEGIWQEQAERLEN